MERMEHMTTSNERIASTGALAKDDSLLYAGMDEELAVIGKDGAHDDQ